MASPPRPRPRWPWLAAGLAALLIGGLVATYLVAAANDQPTQSAAAIPSPTRTFAQPSPVPYSPTPSRTSARPKVSPRETCIRVIQPVQDAVGLYTTFANTTNPSTLDRAPYDRNAQQLRDAHAVAAATLAADIDTVASVMERIRDFLRAGGTINIDAGPFRTAGLALLSACVRLGVAPTAG
jgi:hypothetical protein